MCLWSKRRPRSQHIFRLIKCLPCIHHIETMFSTGFMRMCTPYSVQQLTSSSSSCCRSHRCFHRINDILLFIQSLSNGFEGIVWLLFSVLPLSSSLVGCCCCCSNHFHLVTSSTFRSFDKLSQMSISWHSVSVCHIFLSAHDFATARNGFSSSFLVHHLNHTREHTKPFKTFAHLLSISFALRPIIDVCVLDLISCWIRRNHRRHFMVYAGNFVVARFVTDSFIRHFGLN